jgi:hypothetical protein
MYFFDEETTMLSGRSPNGNVRPAGERCQPFGQRTLLFVSCFSEITSAFGLQQTLKKKELKQIETYSSC